MNKENNIIKKTTDFNIIEVIVLSNVLEYEIIISKLNKLFLLNLDKIMIKYTYQQVTMIKTI